MKKDITTEELHSPALSIPRLETSSHLAFRIGLARKRTNCYPLDSMDFIMTDLERPVMQSHHSFWCTGDLTGRILEFLSCAAIVEGITDERLPILFERILRQRRPSGLIGRAAQAYEFAEPETSPSSAIGRYFSGLLRYYELTGDWRALDAANGLGEFILRNKDKFLAPMDRFGIGTWVTEHFVLLYNATGDSRFLDFCAEIANVPKVDQKKESTHSHGFMSTLRGLQLAALITGDMTWNKIPEYWRRTIIDDRWEMPDGNVAEHFPRSFRNEGCSIADWLMMNLNAGLLGADDAYAKAENILWNALFHNQIINGAFGHRELTSIGCGGLNEPDAWWCCTMHAGMAMTEFARHAVTIHEDAIRVNFLIPGDYSLLTSQCEKVTVKIRTAYPAKADTTVTVLLPRDEMSVDIRIPSCINNSSLAEKHNGNTLAIRLSGEVRHWLERIDENKTIVRFGPLILTPNTYFWREAGRDFGGLHQCNQAPTNYIPPLMPSGVPELLEVKANPTAPSFSLYEEGPASRSYIPGAPADLKLRFDNGEEKVVYARPMCATISSLVAHDSPFMFKATDAKINN